MENSRFRCSKKATIVALSIILGIGFGTLAYSHVVPTVVHGYSAMYIGYDTLEELERASDLIVVVTVAGKGKSVVDPEMDILYTHTPLIVERVFQGNISPGETIEYVELGGYQRRPSGLYYIGLEGYVPIRKNSRYLLFLDKSIDGTYISKGVYQGKFVWPPPRNHTAEHLEVIELDGHYRRLFNSVVAKYGEQD